MPKRLLAKGSIFIDIYKVRMDIYVMNTSKDVVYKVKCLCKEHGHSGKDVMGDACGYTLTFSEESGVFNLVLCSECMDINIVTHETDHMRHFILEYKNIHDEESSANLNGCINEKVFDFLRTNNFTI